MAWYRREKLVLDGFRSLASRIRGVPKNPTFQYGYLNLNLASRGASFNGFSSLCSISQRLGTRGVVGGVNRSFHNPFLLRVKNIHNWLDWVSDDPSKLLFVSTCGGLLHLVYVGKLETIPFTERKHFLLPNVRYKSSAERKFEEMKKFYKGRILPSTHPESVRATMICKDIIGALHRGSGTKQLGSDLRYASVEKAMVVEGDDGTATFMSKEKGQESVSQSEVTSDFDTWNWEIIVVNKPIIWVKCLPGGKIFVSAGSFTHFKSDAEIATVIGHEVAHAVANHVDESFFKKFFYIFTSPLVLTIWPESLFTCAFWVMLTFYLLFFQPYITNKMEMEADYIGLRLLALAGYDPRVAPGVYARLGKVDCESKLWEGPDLHRDRTLAQAMEDAIVIYNDKREAISRASSAPSSSSS